MIVLLCCLCLDAFCVLLDLLSRHFRCATQTASYDVRVPTWLTLNT